MNLYFRTQLYLMIFHLPLSLSAFCFWSWLQWTFEHMLQKIIAFQEVTSVRRAKTAGIFPNAIEIFSGGKKVILDVKYHFFLFGFVVMMPIKIAWTFSYNLCHFSISCNVLIHLLIWQYFFASFLSRDEAFKLINDGWLQQSNGTKAATEQQVF